MTVARSGGSLFVRLLVVCVLVASIFASVSPTATAQGSPIGYLDIVQHHGANNATVYGWALDLAYPTTQVEVMITVDGLRYLTNSRRADVFRPDVGAAFPGVGDYHGFQFQVAMPNLSSSEVCAWARRTSSQFWTKLSNCMTLTHTYPAPLRFNGSTFFQPVYQNISLDVFATDYVYLINGADYAWNGGGNKVSLGINPVSSADHIKFFADDYTGYWGYSARTRYSPKCPNVDSVCPAEPRPQMWTGRVNIYINVPVFTGSGTTEDTRLSTIAHELGHAQGLGHPTVAGADTVMVTPQSAPFRSLLPSAFDHLSIGILYP